MFILGLHFLPTKSLEFTCQSKTRISWFMTEKWFQKNWFSRIATCLIVLFPRCWWLKLNKIILLFHLKRAPLLWHAHLNLAVTVTYILKHFGAQSSFSEFSEKKKQKKKQSFGSKVRLFELTDTRKSLLTNLG